MARVILEDKKIHQLFEDQVEQNLHATAAIFEKEQLTYLKLNELANQLARYLVNFNVGQEVRVGLCLQPSLEALIGLLAILKAGGVYVPLDPTEPKERLAFILEDAQISVLLTQKQIQENLSSFNRRIICLDNWQEIGKLDKNNLVNQISQNHASYLIYTSGTTGVPKGIVAEHRNLTNYILNTKEQFKFSNQDVMSCFDRLVFGISLFELLTPLVSGGTVMLFTKEHILKTDLLIKALEQLTCIHTVPSLMATLVNYIKNKGLKPSKYQNINKIFIGSDRIPLSLIEEMKEIFTLAQIYVLYGCSEVSSLCSSYQIPRECQVKSIILGTPFKNADLRLYDKNRNLLPVGTPGEIYVGGEVVTRGYLNRQKLTQEKYLTIDDRPFYRTGDLGRYLPDGNIEFLGREDNQVKLRGFRIELGEIESALEQHPNIKQTVVTVYKDTSDDKRLVAYLVTDKNQTLSSSDLRSFLEKKLPDYMIPAYFIILDELPLNANGKIERLALPAPNDARENLDTVYVAAKSPLEQLLVNIWEDVLGIKQIGTNDNFFELGGDSIKATFLTNKIQELVGEIIHFVVLLDAPTIALFSVYLEKNYPDAIAKILGFKVSKSASTPSEKVNAEKLAQLRQMIPSLPPRPQPDAKPKNPPAIFILSPHRSGSTLLRVILGGHPQLFAPPEMKLLFFNTLSDRKEALSGRFHFWLEGTVRAIMEICQCSNQEAQHTMEDFEKQQLSTKEFYRVMQQWLGERILLDKTPFYSLNLEFLERAEADFENALYIHLVRNPYGMIRSFEEAKIDQVFYSKNKQPPTFTRRELGEMVWLIAHQNILEFFKQVPSHRQFRVRFEQMVTQPQTVIEGVCNFLNLDFYPEMLQPYKEQKIRMTDGVHPLSKMLGDPKFHQHTSIDSEAADRWKRQYTVDFLCEQTKQLAELLGYEQLGNLGNFTDSDREEIEL